MACRPLHSSFKATNTRFSRNTTPAATGGSAGEAKPPASAHLPGELWHTQAQAQARQLYIYARVSSGVTLYGPASPCR